MCGVCGLEEGWLWVSLCAAGGRLVECTAQPPLWRNPMDPHRAAESLLDPVGGSGVKPRKLIHKQIGLGYSLEAGPSILLTLN